MKKKKARTDDLPLRVGPHGRGRASIPFRLQRLEARIGFVLGALLVWGCALFHPPSAIPWLLALFAAAIGGWARSFQAQHAAWMLLRGTLLQLGGFLLLTSTDIDGIGSIAPLWTIGSTMAYALLLPRPFDSAFVALGLGFFATAALLADPGLPWQIALAVGAAMILLPVLTVSIGRAMRRAEHEVEETRMDSRSHLYNEAGFFLNGGELFEQCRREGRPFSLVLLRAADLRDAVELLGRKAANELFAQTVRTIDAATPAGGLAARTEGVEFAIAMPGLSAEKAEAQLYQRLGRPAKVEVMLKGARAAIVLELVTVQAPREVDTLEALYDRVRARIGKSAGQGAEEPRDSGAPSTLQGLLLHDPAPPVADRPTLPMPLAERRKADHRPRGQRTAQKR